MAGHARRIEDEDVPPPVPRALTALPTLTAVTAPTPGTSVARGTSPAPADAEQPTVDGADAATTARALGLCVVEVLTGGREVDSIARWITDDVHRHLLHRAAIAARARALGSGSRARPILRAGAVRICEPAPGVAEATVVVHTRHHARAVALRLEVRQGRWRATAVGVL